MKLIYNCFIHLFSFGMKVFSLFNPKAKLGIKGRINIFENLQAQIPKNTQTIWMHCASLGEYEQGLPVYEALQNKYPNYTFVISFFSPSGLEVVKKKSNEILFYLPFDTTKNAKKMLDILNPELVVFVKYEYWYNLLAELQNRKVKHIFISSIFRPNQLFFKPYGKWFLAHLQNVTYFFVQNKESKKLLNTHHITQNIVAGDTRFNRVSTLTNENNILDWLTEFKNNSTLIVAGSTWPKDDEIFVQNKNCINENVKLIIAPHEINAAKIDNLRKLFTDKKVILWSEFQSSTKKIEAYNIVILDTIGILTKVYSYADIAYVGGGFGKEGVHNVLEAAVFKTPVIYGPVFDKFIEAKELIAQNGALTISDAITCKEKLTHLLNDEKIRNKMGENAQQYILKNANSVEKIMTELTKIL